MLFFRILTSFANVLFFEVLLFQETYFNW